MIKEDATTPTVAKESLLLLCTIDAEEQQDVATAFTAVFDDELK